MTDPKEKDLYQAWHKRLGHREWRFTVTMTVAQGDQESAPDVLLDAFVDRHPEFGPVVAEDVETRTVSVTFSFQANDPEHAFGVARVAFVDGVVASDLDVEVIDIDLQPTESEDSPTAEHTQLQRA